MQLADVHVVSQWTVQLILWDNYVAFVRLFDKVGAKMIKQASTQASFTQCFVLYT